jgi:outer membrane lipoprotein-sorting protein
LIRYGVRRGELLRWPIVLLFALLMPAVGFSAEDALPEGVEIARKVNARPSGEAVSRSMSMELTDSSGRTRHRTLRSFWKLHPGGRHIAFFVLAPPDLKGEGYLANDYFDEEKDDEYWRYIPRKEKATRIASRQRSQSFLGSDLTLEDIKKESRVEIHEYSWKTVGEETIDDRACYVVEQTPVSPELAEEIGYGRIVSSIDRELWIPRKRVFYKPDLEMLKTVEIKDIRQVSGIWTAHRFEATAHPSGHRTVLRFEDVDYESGVADSVFTIRTLERGLAE